MSKVYLGGTCNNSKWREDLIKMLKIDYFNPVVPDWTAECMEEEIKQRGLCDYCLYVITPNMTGVYSIAEVIDDSNKRPEKTIFCVLKKDSKEYDEEATKGFSEEQIRSLGNVGKIVKKNGGIFFMSLEDVANYLNK